MCWFKWEPLKPNDIIQAIAIPVSLFGAYLIFRLGESSAKSRTKKDFCLRHSEQCIDAINSIESRGMLYWQTPQGKQADQLEYELTATSKRISSETSFLAKFAGKETKHFSEACIELRMAITGGDFASKRRKQAAKQSDQILKICEAATKLRDEVKKLQAELL